MKLKCLGVRYKFFMFSLLRLLDEKSKKEKSHFTSWGYNTNGFLMTK